MFNVVRFFVIASGVFAAYAALGVTATKEWVQTATNAVLQQAKSYGDGRYLSRSGGEVGDLDLWDGDIGTQIWPGAIRFYSQPGGVEDALDLSYEGFCTYDYAAYFPWYVPGVLYPGYGVLVTNSTGHVESISPYVATQAIDHATIAAWQTYWDGDDVRVTVTNYYGQTGMPHLYLEEKMQPDETHPDTWFKTVWDEMTRWNAFLSSYAAVTNDLRQNYADRAWGVYDSSTGNYSPDDMLQLSQPSIQIAAGLAWQKTVLTSGSVWVLKSTTPATITGTSANGFMRLLDGDGNTMVEIIKGDKRIVGATATALEMQGARMRVTYSVTSDSHPTMSLCTDLADPNWVEEGAAGAPATVSWSGSSGAWVATVAPIGNRPSMFARATYETGGSTYINAAVPIGFSKVVIGGHEYNVTVETVSGKRVMVLQ